MYGPSLRIKGYGIAGTDQDMASGCVSKNVHDNVMGLPMELLISLLLLWLTSFGRAACKTNWGRNKKGETVINLRRQEMEKGEGA